jgi:hypothetical protein
MDKSPAVEHCIEILCSKGCRQVWQYIEQLRRGEELLETRGLSDAERHLVLIELQAIMAVYGERCSVD